MERKQGFFSALKEEVVRGLSPSRSRANSPARTGSPTIMSGLLRRKKSHHAALHEAALIARSGSLRPLGETLTPLMEGPDQDGAEIGESKRSGSGLGQWMKGQLGRTPTVTASSMGYNNNSSSSSRRSDLRILLGVMGAPLAPLHVSTTDPLPHLSIKDTPIVSLSLSLCETIQMGSFWFSKIVVLIFWDFIYFYFLRVGLVLFFSNLKKKKKCY